MAKSCPKGQYYCYTDKKCKKIPKGYVIGARGYLRQEPQDDDSKKNGNGNGNGHSKSNGSSRNGGGNGNGGNGGNGGGGGMSEATMTSSQKRKDTMLKKKYDDSDMKKNMKKQYGKEEGEKVYYATIRKQAMEQRNPNTGLPMGLKSTSDTKTDQKMKKVPYEMLRAHLEIPVTDIQVSTMDELTDYRSFAARAQEVRDKKAKRREEKQKADKEYMAKKKERVQKGIKFYDTKGQGYVKGGVKTYEDTIDEISPANPTRFKEPNPYSLRKKLKMIIRSLGAGPIKEEQPVYSTKEFTKFGRSKYPKNTPFVIDDFIKNRAKELFKFKTGIPLAKNIKTEGSLHKWFKGSKSKDGKPGWVNVKTGGTCASDEPGEGTPKCVSSSKRASMSKAERESASRRKKAADPNQQSKSGAAKPTYVSTDKKKVKKESIDLSEMGKKFGSGNPTGKIDKAAQLKALKKLKDSIPVKKIDTDVNMEDAKSIFSTPALDKLKKLKDYQKNADKVFGRETKPLQSDYKPEGENIEEARKAKAKRAKAKRAKAKDKKGKGSGSKDACYHKVKSRYSVWPSAYGSGALVKCREVGAANWGNSKKEEFEGNKSYNDFMGEAKKCWKGYKKTGTQKLFGKTYNRCEKEEVEFDEGVIDTIKNVGKKVKEFIKKPIISPTINQKDYQKRVKDKTTHELVGEGSAYGIYKGDGKPKGPMANFGDDKEKKKKKKSYEEFQQDCWDTHKKVGMKMKGGKLVNDCRPKNEEVEITDGKKLSEDDMKGMSVSSGHKRPTKSGAGMTAKGIAAYRRRNPGSKLKGAVTGKVKKGSKAAKRRSSYCARSAGQMKKFPKAAKDPNSRLRQARRRWKC
jgi:hypothetical protein